MAIRFTKMHGIGNDFVVLDGVTQQLQLKPRDIRRLADRRRGVGCDQVLIAEPPGRPDVDFRYRIFNADGSEAGQCGNGARCFARFLRHRKLTAKRLITVETQGGLMTLRVLDKHEVEVDMGAPRLEPADIPLDRPARADSYDLTVDGETLRVGALSMGNPHAVLRVDDVAHCDLERLGPEIEGHPAFPERVNAGFAEIVDRGTLRLRVYERGAGETLACGSGACAAVVWGRRQGWLDEQVTVHLPGGKLSVSWAGDGEPVLLRGPTAIAFEGTIRL
ncbi:diaminopimelate epimerase [Pseudohaliea rubra]|uniref:Diaminopimelate epimerase n=1 Tax=Pseudohaliea rubra DSM 19751 TaxID=1265313 RepID=A0A095VRC9_9GAMM|nr:diaminopimelate epimerase [Pseudohaliea rubra]KGE04012.1 Diaminopimelate epimerase [Pseudohaliea rubra DSM 19751]